MTSKQRRLSRSERDEIVMLYLCGLSMEETAKQAGCHPSTVRKTLDARRVEIRPDTGAQPRQPLCRAGLHDMEVYGKERVRKNAAGELVVSGRECTECRRIRQRVTP